MLPTTYLLILAVAVVVVVGFMWIVWIRPGVRARERRDRSADYLYVKPTTPAGRPLTTLPVGDLCAVLLGALIVFSWLLGPFWAQESAAFDAGPAIFWSYLVIPPLVAVALGARDLMSWRAFLTDSAIVALLKFVITAFVIVGTFSTVGHGAPTPTNTIAKAATTKKQGPPPSSDLTGIERRTVTGRVVADGRPVADALVWVATGLDELAFAPPTEPISLTNDGIAIRPTPVVLRTWQPLRLVGADARTHTIEGIRRRDSEPQFNLPMVSGLVGMHRMARPGGLLRVRCVVHDRAERAAHMLLLHHPYWTRTDADGRFRLADVPHPGPIGLEAFHPDHARLEVR